jgi:nucleotide-binding universal stress UspA family protein
MTIPFPGPAPGALLVCTEGSAASQGAVEAALVLARRWSSRMVLLQVLEYNPGYASQAIDALEGWEQQALAGLNAIAERAASLGLAAEVVVRPGETPHRAILAEAGQRRVDLIIMGRRGRSDLINVIMGSVTARVIEHSPINVLVVPRRAPLTFQRLLVATDGSPCSEPAWRHALALARAWFCHLLAVCVATQKAAVPEAQATLEKLQSEADRQGIPLDTLTLTGTPDEAILKAGEARGVDLFIVGSRRRSGFSRVFLGSVAEQVIGKARCPVLVVKPQS